MTTVARKKGTQTFEATHLWNSLKIRVSIWGLQWMNYHFSLNWKFVSSNTHMQPHIDSIHSPQRTRKTIMKLCMKSVKFHLGIIFWGNRSTLSEIRWSCQMISQDALPRICHCVIKNSSLRISPFAPNLYSFCRRAACPWQRRWRWWYRGRMWGFPEHQWFSP